MQHNNQQPAMLLPTYKGAPMANCQLVFEDSFLVKRFAQNYLNCDTDILYSAIKMSAPWTEPSNPDLKLRGHELARQKFFLNKSEGLILSSDTPLSQFYKYSYPGFQYGSLLSYRALQTVPLVHYFNASLEEHLLFNGEQVTLNHVIGTMYRGEADNISYHSDSLKDITPDTPIISLSLGETREMHLGRVHPKDRKKTIFEKAVVLEPGDMFILGPRTNVLHRHAIARVIDERVIKRVPGVPIGPRISLVSRNIQTIVSLDTVQQEVRNTNKRRLQPKKPKNKKKVKKI